MMQAQVDRYAVIGNPISHSKSPFIHAEFARQTGEKILYTAELVEIGQVKEFIDEFARHSGKGLNVTVPFKIDAFNIATQLSSRARRAGAVNTIELVNGEIIADTTDGIGLLNDLTKNHRQSLTNKRILIIGAGGAVRGSLEPLLLQSPQSMTIANRTVSKAEQIAKDYAELFHIEACDFNALEGKHFDIVINGTSASLSGELPPLPDKLFADNAMAYDMMYAAEPTPFMQWASQQGASHIHDGLGMLVEQAAESFYIWRKKRPETQGVINKLREKILNNT